MPHAIRIHETGGPEVLRWEEIEVGEPGPGQVKLRQEAAGLNFIDVYHRQGLYPQQLPFTPGVEGAGVVEAVGSDVTNVRPGDRVAYAGPTGGSDEKADIARAHGCDHPIVYTREDFVAEVERITHGEKLPVVYDGVGRDTFMNSLDCLRPRGLMVSFGNASGSVEPFAPTLL